MKENKEGWYSTKDTDRAVDYLMDNHAKLHTRIMKNENERVELIQSIGFSNKIPKEIAALLPWKPKKIEVRKNSDESYYLLSNELLEIDRYRREISRIKQSGAYRLMNLITRSVRSPKKIILLPFTFTKLSLQIVNQRRGKTENSTQNQFPIGYGSGSRNCIVFFPTNGVGFGHFTRLLSLAKKIREKDKGTLHRRGWRSRFDRYTCWEGEGRSSEQQTYKT